MITECEVKQARTLNVKLSKQGKAIEIMLLGKQSEISDCTDIFNIPQVEDKISHLTDLRDLDEYSLVNVHIKVVDIAGSQHNTRRENNSKILHC